MYSCFSSNLLALINRWKLVRSRLSKISILVSLLSMLGWETPLGGPSFVLVQILASENDIQDGQLRIRGNSS